LPHDRTVTMTDALDVRLGGPGYENLLVLGATQATFFCSRAVIDALRKRYPGG
jgi:hypothetical protein